MALKTIVAATDMSTISSEDKPSFSGAIIPLPVVDLVLILVDVVVRKVDVLS